MSHLFSPSTFFGNSSWKRLKKVIKMEKKSEMRNITLLVNADFLAILHLNVSESN